MNPLVRPDPGLYVWTIVTFGVLVLLLWKYAWGPLLAALDRREKMIAGAVDDARKAREELERVKQDSTKVLAEARKDAEGIVSRTRADAEKLREELRKKAADEAAGIVTNAERRIQQETAKAIQQIRGEAVDMSLAIASKILQRTVTKDDNERLIADVVNSLEKRPN
jgi:F-type H+-transporting ATPase subunit b